jgi:hypothetical protein
MNVYKKVKANQFEKHPVLTILLFVLVCIFVFDFSVANIYKLINGYSWNDALWVENKTEKSYRVRSDQYHHDLAKNKEIRNAKYRNYKYKVYTNSLGFKDRAVKEVTLSSSKHRILFIGDSFTEAIGLNYEDTFVGLIDAKLSRNGIEVLNAAVCSYSPTIYWRKIKYLIEDVGLKFDEVVVFLDMSDITDEAICYLLDENGNVVLKNAIEYSDKASYLGTNDSFSFVNRILKNLKSAIKNNSILTYSIFMRIRTKLNAFEHKTFAIQTAWELDKDVYKELGERGLNKAALYMDKLNGLLKAHGVKLTVAVYPWPQQVAYNDLDAIQANYWGNWSKRNGVSFINYFPYFVIGKTEKERNAVIEKYYMEGDCHLNKEGQRLVADIFLNFYKN